jgi:transcriptional regulator with XRE-family HTH domain
VTPEGLGGWRKRMGLTQAQAAVALGLGLRMYRYYERGEREGGRRVAIPLAVELAARQLEADKTRPPAAKIEKAVLEDILTVIGDHLPEATTLCVVGSAAAILYGQPERQTADVDVWGPESDFDTGALRRACAKAGVLFDPRDEVAPGAIYMQIMRPGVTMFPERFAVQKIARFGKLHVVMPPPELIVATKLARALESDIEDAAWWIRERNIPVDAVEAAIERIPQPENREAARENLMLVQLVAKGPKR